MSSFCEWAKTDDGVFHLKLTGVDGHHYLTKEALHELRQKLAEIRELASSSPEPCRGLITSSSSSSSPSSPTTGSFCDGIDHKSLRANMAAPVAEQARCARPRGAPASLGLALALAHDDLVVLSDAYYKLGNVEDGVAVPPHVAALVREKTDRWYTLTTLKSRPRTGSWMRRWYFADGEAASRDGVVREAERLVGEWPAAGEDGKVHAETRRQLYRESWEAVCAIVHDE
ncbi:hypothetical protein OsJ_33597 [Oryza sativa Japonica Group]|uniref:Uncharacterized protein n=1 Tax=Oryza sativa subsp. japonica TaxID=39947 RepID=B9GA97_ORYSJ|nr:hypothetical protein OsJ_33597 [Oryza sativa Japonica Group]